MVAQSFFFGRTVMEELDELADLEWIGVYYACCKRAVLVQQINERMHCPHCGFPTEPVMVQVERSDV